MTPQFLSEFDHLFVCKVLIVFFFFRASKVLIVGSWNNQEVVSGLLNKKGRKEAFDDLG